MIITLMCVCVNAWVQNSQKIWWGIKFGSFVHWPAYCQIKIHQYKVSHTRLHACTSEVFDWSHISWCDVWVVAAVLGDLYLCKRWMTCHCINPLQKLACQCECHKWVTVKSKKPTPALITYRRKVNGRSSGRPKCYNDYTPEERTSIGKYTIENRVASSARHFSQLSTASQDSTLVVQSY